MVRYFDVTVHYCRWINSDQQSIKNPALIVPAAMFKYDLIDFLASRPKSIIAVTIIQSATAAKLIVSS